MKKKIGIISFHSSINYGVYLQAYALQEAIRDLGYDPEIIDYNNMTEESEKNNKSFIYRIIHIKETIQAIKLRQFRLSNESKNREALFNDFKSQYFNLSPRIENYEKLESIKDKYYSFVCGSDQIWNPQYTKGNPAYFLAFAAKEKRNMYAPSYGISNVDVIKPFEDMYKDYLINIHGLSVRESSGIEITQKICGRTPELVVDPTLLLSKEKWTSIEKNPGSINGKYILFYVLGHDKRYTLLANILSKKTNIKVVTIPVSPIWKCNENISTIYASVQNFIYLIHNAELVVTDSFHGVVFSTIFRRNLIALIREDTKISLASRIQDYLSKVGLEKCCHSISESLNGNIRMHSDYSSYENLFSVWQSSSRNYLNDALK